MKWYIFMWNYMNSFSTCPTNLSCWAWIEVGSRNISWGASSNACLFKSCWKSKKSIFHFFFFFHEFLMSTYSKTLNIFKISTKTRIYSWWSPTWSNWCYRLSWSRGSRRTPSWSSYRQKSKSSTFFFNIAFIPTK